MNHRILSAIACLLAFTSPSCIFADAVNSKTSFHLEGLYLQPSSNNLKYAVFVSGNQPYQQSWHNQSIKPGYSPAFELGVNYNICPSGYNLSVDWLHVNTNNSGNAQASQNTDVATVEFVAPPYDVGPAVFGIKRAASEVNFNFDQINVDLGKTFIHDANLKGRIFTGLSFLNIRQKLTTTFSNYAGSPPLPGQAYALPADPRFYFTTKNTSHYTGVGPNLGFAIEYDNCNGFGAVAQFIASLTAGSISTKDTFQSSSQRLIALGLSPSNQEITAPANMRLVPGLDSKLGLLYTHAWKDFSMTMEAGYRFAYYINAISSINPDSLVQAGDDPTIPEFATGTMAINATTSSDGPFSLQGPYLNLIFQA